MKIRCIDRKELNEEAYTLALKKSKNYLLFSEIPYLDILTKNKWKCLVEGNYERVLPLPYKMKWGIFKVIYQPFFIQQFSIYGEPDAMVDSFIKAIPWYFIKVHLQLSECTYESKSKRVNYLLPLKKPYEELYRQFNNDAKKNLKKLMEFQAEIQKMPCSTDQLIDSYQKMWGQKQAHIKTTHYENLKKVLELVPDHLKDIGLYQTREGVLLAVFAFVLSGKNWQYLLAAPTKQGLNKGIMHWVINEKIKQHAEEDAVLDFEGSEIEGVSKFYQKWNPQKTYYCCVERKLWGYFIHY